MPTPRVVRRRRLVRICGALLAVGLAAVLALHIDMLRSAHVSAPQASVDLSPEEFQILKLVNEVRARGGKEPLDFSAGLILAARAHSHDMAERHYLGHDSPAGDTPADRLRVGNVNYEELAENIFSDKVKDRESLPGDVVRRWLQSPEHRDNLLSPRFRTTGVGVARSPEGIYYVTEDFIR